MIHNTTPNPGPISTIPLLVYRKSGFHLPRSRTGHKQHQLLLIKYDTPSGCSSQQRTSKHKSWGALQEDSMFEMYWIIFRGAVQDHAVFASKDPAGMIRALTELN